MFRKEAAMQVYVCVKHVPDTAAKISVVGGNEFAETCKFIVNPYDEYGIEEAVQQVKQTGSGEVVIVTVGKESAMVTLRAALAQGADRGILVKTDSHFLDSSLTALALHKVIEQDGSPDLIFCGKLRKHFLFSLFPLFLVIVLPFMDKSQGGKKKETGVRS